ncbi:hypothetical protein, partial [Pseudogemmobacter hezensis]|uniref:hypothetical protein n=1 Tax=Pseudogemmobacter hezensis TaxID=2737662 RepID=UPI001C12F290
MKNELLPHPVIRGGRLVKWKGQVASIAPFVAGVAASAAMMGGLTILSAGSASAAACNVAN